MKLDLNCDLGEGEPPARTRGLLDLIDSANIACGGHAGNVRTMELSARWALARGVHLGAHPGLPGHFGRKPQPLDEPGLKRLVVEQVELFTGIVRKLGGRLHHIKLHGWLYHVTETDDVLRRAFVSVVADHWPKVRIYARAGGAVVRAARVRGIRVWPEAFADRNYDETGHLIPRGQPGALLTKPTALRERIQALLRREPLRSVDGHPIDIRARTICLHGDSARALATARVVRAEIDAGSVSQS